MSKNYQVELQIKGASASDQEQSAGRFKNLNDENSSHFRSTIHRSNPLSRLTFAFIAPIIYRSWKRDERGQELTENDLLTFPHHLRGDSLEKKFMQRIRNQEKKSLKKTVSTALAVLGTSKWMFFKAAFLQTAFCFIRIFICWVMKRLIDSYLDPEKYNTDAFWWAGIMVGLLAIELFVCHHWSYSTLIFTGHMRVGIINMIYNKITRLSGYTITKLSPGQLVNLAANDVNTIEQLGFFFPTVVAGLLTMIAGAALLWIYFGVTCLIGIVYLLVNIPLQGLIANASKKPRNEKNDVTDERVRRTGEMIQDIRLLKMYTWEMKFKEIITSIRKKDCSLNNQVIFWDSLSRALAWSSVYVSSFLVFMLYDVTGGNLQVSEVFSGYFIFAFLKVFAGYFIAISVGFMAEAKLFFDRLNGIMEAPEMGEVKFEKPHDTKNSVEFENFNGYWEKEESAPLQSTTTEQNLKTQAPKDIKPTLADINIHLKRRSLNAVVGPVGSGKTSFLLTFTAEMPFSTGQLRYQGSVAYVEQEPTIFAGTFRESILFGKPYNEEFYNQVIKACNLENDLKLFPKGDMSMIGERGNNLSGGQKARLSLARAVYADADIYLLDDPLSAVDAKVAKSIYEETILGLLKEKTVILVTHQVHFVRDAGNIIVMEGGRILSNGTFDQLKEQGVDVNRIFSVEEKKKKNDEDEEEEENEGSPLEKQATATVGGDNEEEKLIKKKEEKVVKSSQPADNGEDTSHFSSEDPHAGQVNVKTYVLLFKEIGWAFMFLIFVLSVFTQFGDVAFGRILGAWTATQFNLGESLGSLGGIALYMFTIHLVKNLAVSYGLFAAAKGYHQKMLDKIVRSTVSFFDLNPVGRILNRFSNDIGVLDKFFPSVCLDVFDTFFTAGAVAITLGIIQPLLLAPILGAFVVIGILVRLFFPAIKKTKGFDLGTRGPLFSLLSSSIAGVGIIRTFNNINFFQKKFGDLLYVNSKGAINFVFASTFLGFCVDASYCLAAMGMIFITTAKIEPNPASGAIAAFTLALILSLTGFFQHGVRQLCQTNVLMASVSRVQAYSNLPTEAPIATSHDADCKSQHWPQKGDIEFNKVYMKYRPELDYTIRALDLHANPGEKIGCVGRTGAGKSTIINLLFRLQEIDRSGDNAKDSYIKIDGVNTQPLGLHLLRGNISIIPQTPFIFTGTIKENLDPLGEFTDQQVWDALAEVRLKEHVEALPDKIKTNMNNASSVFSTGQKQLICLARTLLKPCKVLVLDEATANMDTETDMFIQKKIMEKFADSTVFTIAHRLATIANYDKVLVLDKGRKVEFDTPYKLLAKNIGDETLTNTEGHFGSMVVRTGPKASQRILNIAKEAYYQKKNKVNLDI